MATRIAEKVQRAFEFLMGMGDPRARRAIAGHGFTDADLDDGWARLMALSKVPVLIGESPAAEALAALDAWENRWFPIIDAVLRPTHAAAHELVFRNLRQTEGAQVLVSVQLMLDRLDTIARPKSEGGLAEAGEQARAHHARRGVTGEVLDQARALLARVPQSRPDDDPIADPEARAAAEAHLWAWYLEWSGIARAVIKDRRILNALGFRGRGRKKS